MVGVCDAWTPDTLYVTCPNHSCGGRLADMALYCSQTRACLVVWKGLSPCLRHIRDALHFNISR